MSARYNPAIAPDAPRPPLTRGHCAALELILAAGGLAFVELEVTPPAGKEEIHVSVAGR